jgi:hypothetical protein
VEFYMAFSFFRGGLIATIGAGPIFLMMFGLALWTHAPGEAINLNMNAQDQAALLPMLAASLVFGALLAVLPVCIGGVAMGWAAARNAGLMHPAIWAIAGGASAAGAALPFDPQIESPFAFAMIATGALCALIVRYGTRWSDDNAPLTPHAINACAAK